MSAPRRTAAEVAALRRLRRALAELPAEAESRQFAAAPMGSRAREDAEPSEDRAESRGASPERRQPFT